MTIKGLKLCKPATLIFMIATLVLGGAALCNDHIMLALAMNTEKLNEGYRLITYGFLGGGIIHVLGNVLGFYYVGRLLEEKIGSICYMLLTFFLLVTSALIEIFVFHQKTTTGVGGSSAIYGLIAILFVYYIKHRDIFENEKNAPVLRGVAAYFIIGNLLILPSLYPHIIGFVIGVICALLLLYIFHTEKAN